MFFVSTAWNVVKPGTEEGNLENGCRASGRTEMAVLFNGAKDGKPQCTILAVFSSQKGIME
jgi:hypothetical protein